MPDSKVIRNGMQEVVSEDIEKNWCFGDYFISVFTEEDDANNSGIENHKIKIVY